MAEPKARTKLTLDDLGVKGGVPILCDKTLVFTRHVLERMHERRISLTEVFTALQHIKPGQLGNQRVKRKIFKETMLICVDEQEFKRTIITIAFDGVGGGRTA